MTLADDLVAAAAREISEVDGHASEVQPCGDATYPQMARASVVETLTSVVGWLRYEGSAYPDDCNQAGHEWRDAYEQAANDLELLAEEIERAGSTADLLQVARAAMHRDPTTTGVVAAVSTVVQVAGEQNQTKETT